MDAIGTMTIPQSSQVIKFSFFKKMLERHFNKKNNRMICICLMSGIYYTATTLLKKIPNYKKDAGLIFYTARNRRKNTPVGGKPIEFGRIPYPTESFFSGRSVCSGNHSEPGIKSADHYRP
ncbi:MAG: hypothetical protein J6C40_11840, partial [Lentisphaeria bacterium]|nr:hypothetical protein [Lentisphaeria bacterium]